MSKQTNFIRRFVRWILPLLVLVLIGLYLVLSPIAFTHAAAPARHSIAAPQQPAPQVQPDMFWPY